MNIDRLIQRTAVAVLLLCIVGVAQAQVWNTNTITADAPTACTTGEPISACPVTGYRVERASSQTGTFAIVGTTTTLSFTHTSAVAGTNCYRWTAMSARGDSVPSTVTAASCIVNTPPVGPPGPPTNVRVTVAVVAGDLRTPIFSIAGREPNLTVGTYFGSVPVGTPCGDYLFTYRKAKFHRVVPDSTNLWGRTELRGLVSPCG